MRVIQRVAGEGPGLMALASWVRNAEEEDDEVERGSIHLAPMDPIDVW